MLFTKIRTKNHIMYMLSNYTIDKFRGKKISPLIKILFICTFEI